MASRAAARSVRRGPRGGCRDRRHAAALSEVDRAARAERAGRAHAAEAEAEGRCIRAAQYRDLGRVARFAAVQGRGVRRGGLLARAVLGAGPADGACRDRPRAQAERAPAVSRACRRGRPARAAEMAAAHRAGLEAPDGQLPSHAPHGSGDRRGGIRDRADPARKHPQGAAHCQAEHSRNSAQALDVHSLPQRLNEETMEDSSRDLQNDHLNSLVPDVRVDRRGFVAACLAAGFAVTAEPVLAQAIKTSMEGLDGGDIKIGDIPAYYAVPKTGGKRPVVLVVAEIWGLHEHIKDVVRRGAKEGYFAVATEPYFRIRDRWTGDEIKHVLAGSNQLADEQAFKDLDAVVAWANKQPRANTENPAITGFCGGGGMLWMYSAQQKTLAAGVAWYGTPTSTPAAM